MKFRKSIRLCDYDYSAEAFYFITICTNFKAHILAEISDGESYLSHYGNIVTSCWNNIEKQFSAVRTDCFVVMPNHVHGILQITQSKVVKVSTVIQNFKSVSSRRINEVRKSRADSVWQRNYFERIIRTEKELSLTRLYIMLNPRLWERRTDLAELGMGEDEVSKLLDQFRKYEP